MRRFLPGHGFDAELIRRVVAMPRMGHDPAELEIVSAHDIRRDIDQVARIDADPVHPAVDLDHHADGAADRLRELAIGGGHRLGIRDQGQRRAAQQRCDALELAPARQGIGQEHIGDAAGDHDLGFRGRRAADAHGACRQLALRHGCALMRLDMRAQGQLFAPRQPRHARDIGLHDIEVHQHGRRVEPWVVQGDRQRDLGGQGRGQRRRHGPMLPVRIRAKPRRRARSASRPLPIRAASSVMALPPASTPICRQARKIRSPIDGQRRYLAVNPPSSTRQLPTAKELSSLARNRAP